MYRCIGVNTGCNDHCGLRGKAGLGWEMRGRWIGLGDGEKAGYGGGNGVLKYSILLFEPDYFKQTVLLYNAGSQNDTEYLFYSFI